MPARKHHHRWAPQPLWLRITDSEIWATKTKALIELAANIPTLRYLDIGGGFGLDIDLSAVDSALLPISEANPNIEIWIEPGRFVVADSQVSYCRPLRRSNPSSESVLLAQMQECTPSFDRPCMGLARCTQPFKGAQCATQRSAGGRHRWTHL